VNSAAAGRILRLIAPGVLVGLTSDWERQEEKAMSRATLVAFTFVIVAAVAAAPSHAATAFMYIDGVAGNSPTDKTHTDWIDLTKFIVPVQSDQPPTLGGLGPSLGDIVIGKNSDAASTALMQGASNGTIYTEVKIDLCIQCGDPGPNNIFFIGEWTAELAEFANLGPPPLGEPGTESYSLTFSSFKYEYSEQDDTGEKQGGSYRAEWPDPAQSPNTSTEGSPTGPYMLLDEFLVPEPATVLLFASGLLLAGTRRRGA
jgi:type VI protein secretion system component Hcp